METTKRTQTISMLIAAIDPWYLRYLDFDQGKSAKELMPLKNAGL
jgi:hypothetical protein